MTQKTQTNEGEVRMYLDLLSLGSEEKYGDMYWQDVPDSFSKEFYEIASNYPEELSENMMEYARNYWEYGPHKVMQVLLGRNDDHRVTDWKVEYYEEMIDTTSDVVLYPTP